MKGLSSLCILLLLDGIWGLIKGWNLWTLKPSHYILANVVTIVAMLIIGPALWETAKRRDYLRAMRLYRETGDDTGVREWDRNFH